MKRILVTTDFSDKAWNALIYAIELYKNVPCLFTILNTYELNSTQLLTTVSSQRVGYFYDSIKLGSEEGLEMTLEDINNSNPASHHVFKTISKLGSLTEVLMQMTVADSFDLILMSTKGMTGAKEVFIGSNAIRVLQSKFNTPVLIVPEDAYFERITNIAFATDFERIYYRSEIKPIIDLAKINNAAIRMIHVHDQPKLSLTQNYNSKRLEEFFRHIKNDFHVIPEFTSIKKSIQVYIEELEINMLIMINYEHSFIERLTREAVIKKITFHTKIPFLVIPADY
ncbi:universal stress protein [Aquimarina sp. AU474]|uniref:universal stress protein n=1 Tax=Aquimarina sp. AU474 TaxID=2108529 RepID=UPI000D69E8B0|nr:universal stress protein [Aquimarina sp. AU474]